MTLNDVILYFISLWCVYSIGREQATFKWYSETMKELDKKLKLLSKRSKKV